MTAGDRRVAVVMITHNRRDEVLSTLAHLAALPERPRVVVVDNNSTDGTPAAVRERFPAVEALDAGGNLGSAGRSLGVLHVDAPYVAFCDDDSWWEPDSLRRAADLLDAHPRVGLLTGRTLVGPQERDDPINADLGEGRLPDEPGLPGRPVLGFLACAAVVRRSAYLEAGGFCRHLGVGGEESWLAVELAVRGWSLCYVPELVVHHYPSTRRDVRLRQWRGVRNGLWFAWTYRPVRIALRKTWELTWGGRDRAAVRGFAAALAGLPRVLRGRRIVPADLEEQLRLLDAPTAPQGPQTPGPFGGCAGVGAPGGRPGRPGWGRHPPPPPCTPPPGA
jgi:GT2 family glycosyltransferase